MSDIASLLHKPQLFIDMDGVLADFYQHYFDLFGIRLVPDQKSPKEDWDKMIAVKTFYRDLPMIPDAKDLWEGAKQFHPRPIILTAVPRNSARQEIIPDARQQKRAWAAQHLGLEAAESVVCCYSVEKYLYGRPGDILVDDRLKYSKLWTDMGGVFIHHRSAVDTLGKLPLYYKQGITA